MEKNFNTNGSARFKNIEALTAWLENLDAEAAGKTCDRLLAIRKGEIPRGRSDAIQDAISASFQVTGYVLSKPDWATNVGPSKEEKWAMQRTSLIERLQKFYNYCTEFGQTPNVGFWADGEYAFLYLGNPSSGIIVPEPEKYLEYIPPKDYSAMTPLQVRKQLGVGISQEDGDMQSLVSAEVEASLTGADLKKSLEDQNQAIADIEQEMKDTREAKTGELAELRMELERVQAELDAKKSALMAELEQKKRYMEQMKEQMENQIYMLDSQIYAIRCFAGEVVQFARIRSGRNAPVTEPIVIHQKLRFLDEDLGRLASLYEIQWERLDLFEQFLRHSPLALDTFAPNERCVVLVRLSRTGTQQGRDNIRPYTNLFKNYEYYHGKTVGIIIRNGENLYLGWTEEDRVHIEDDLLISKVVTEVTPGKDPEFMFESEREQYEQQQKAERRRFVDGLVSRSFVYNILQGIVEHTDMLPLPEGVALNKPSEYVIYSVADKWLADNRFGSFNEIVEKSNNRVTEGDMLLTVQHLIPERSSWGGNYSPRWDNVRGRGDRNRTHDCHVDDCKIYPANLVEYDEPVSKTRFKRLVPPGYFELQKNPGAKPAWREFVEYTDWYEPLHNEDGSEVPPDEQDQIIEVFDYRRQHVYISVPKMFSYADARSNFELQPEEYINLTYLNSVWLEWAVTTKNLGGWTVGGKEVTYAYAIKYIKTALDFIRKREKEEKAHLDAVDSTITQDPDWPLRLSEWKLEKGVRQITPYQAKRFAKYYRRKDEK